MLMQTYVFSSHKSSFCDFQANGQTEVTRAASALIGAGKKPVLEVLAKVRCSEAQMFPSSAQQPIARLAEQYCSSINVYPV